MTSDIAGNGNRLPSNALGDETSCQADELHALLLELLNATQETLFLHGRRIAAILARNCTEETEDLFAELATTAAFAKRPLPVATQTIQRPPSRQDPHLPWNTVPGMAIDDEVAEGRLLGWADDDASKTCHLSESKLDSPRHSESEFTSVKPEPANTTTKNEFAQQTKHALSQGDGLAEVENKRERGVFADPQAMKIRVKANLTKKEYDVTAFYHDEGWAQMLAKSKAFEKTTLGLILLNALWLWVDTDLNKAPTLLGAQPIFIFAENFWCVYFSFEWLVRFLAFKSKLQGLKDGWFAFDTVLMVTMVLETWVFTVAMQLSTGGQLSVKQARSLKLVRLIRLTRLGRVVRIFRAVPELMVMIRAMMIAIRSVMFSLCILLGMVYVFALAFTQLLDGEDSSDESVANTKFRTVAVSMNTLLLQGALPDQADMIDDLGKIHWAYHLFMLFFMLLASLTVMNMLIGTLCQVVSVVSTVENEELQIAFVKSELQQMIESLKIDADSSGLISKQEFQSLLINPKAARTLQDVGVDVVALVDIVDFLFETAATEMSFDQFLDVVLQLRGSNQATVRDLVDLRKFLMAEFERSDTQLAHMRTSLGIACQNESEFQ
eukprot:TRINITY_DN43102_c0_g1_i1.p1 TRINITY_DN43102_c0_g1~~TRINITY_DN43102_c0_g1_i1.p1  ORF type:complete len:608 (+),score=115.53 TRINITY_DN43102_c0_g1_i1:77-1900(+)